LQLKEDFYLFFYNTKNYYKFVKKNTELNLIYITLFLFKRRQMATAFEVGAGETEEAGLEELSAKLKRVTDAFCNLVVEAENNDIDFHIDQTAVKREFSECVNMLPLLDVLAANLTQQIDGRDLKAVCATCVGLEGEATLENIRQGLVDLQNAVIYYYDGFLANRFVRACPLTTRHARVAMNLSDIPDINVQPSPEILKDLKKKNFALTRIPEILSIICNKLNLLFAIVDCHIKLQTNDDSISNLNLHLSSEIASNTELRATADEKKVIEIADYVLNTLHSLRAHKVVPNQGESCAAKMVEVWTPVVHDHISTGVYRPGINEKTKLGLTLEAYVNKVLSPNPQNRFEACPPHLAGVAWNYADKVASYIAKFDDARFPFDDPNPHLIAFPNGTLNTLNVKFTHRCITEEATWGSMLAREEVSSPTEMDAIQRLADTHAALMQTDDNIRDHLYSCANTQPCMFVPHVFDPDMMDMPLSKLEELAVGFKTILSHQEIPNEEVVEGKEAERKDVRNWIYAMIGRSMIGYESRFDSWQLCLFLLGCAGTGKSTILNLIQMFFPPQTVKFMEDEGETTFGFQAFVTSLTRLIIGSEIPLNMPMATIAKGISHEGISVAIKNKGAVYVNPWIAEFMFAGNGMPTKGNNGGRLTRRFLIVPFNISVSNQASNIEKHMKDNLPAYIMLCVRAYNIIGKKYGSQDFWVVAPKFFKEQAQSNFVQSNSLALFLNSPMFLMDEQYKNEETPWCLIEKAALEYAGNGAAREQMKTNLNLINRNTVCSHLGLTLSAKRKKAYYENKQYYGFWVKGIVFAEKEDPSDTMEN
jgi:hypothetical protein